MSVVKECEDRVWQRSSDFVTREIAGELLLVPVGAQTKKLNGFVTFTDTGAFLWKQLEGGATAAQLAEKLAGEYGQVPGDVLADVESFLQKAAAQGLIL